MVAAARNPPPHVHRAPEARLHLRDSPVPLTLIPECSVILSEASLRAKSKDPQLVASSGWVADPSQAQDDSQPVWDPKRTGRCTSVLSCLHANRSPTDHAASVPGVAGQLHIADAGSVASNAYRAFPVRHRPDAHRRRAAWKPQLLVVQERPHAEPLATW